MQLRLCARNTRRTGSRSDARYSLYAARIATRSPVVTNLGAGADPERSTPMNGLPLPYEFDAFGIAYEGKSGFSTSRFAWAA